MSTSEPSGTAESSRTVGEILRDVDATATAVSAREAGFPTGFEPLDEVLEGGLRPHDLTLVGGEPGVGKTIVTLQWARTMAANGSTVVFACYEHEPNELLGRLLCLELGTVAHPDNRPALPAIRRAVREAVLGERSLLAVVTSEPLLRLAYERVEAYADHLMLVQASGRRTDLAALEQLVVEHGNGRNVLVVDYLQKVPFFPAPDLQEERTTRVVEGLKDLALAHDVAIVAVCAADWSATTRVQLRHLRGAATLAYEADLAVLINDKLKAVSKAHSAYDAVRAEEFKRYAVFSLEKHRSGQAHVDLEFVKDFGNFRFEPHGGFVAERLVDDVVVLD